MKKALFILVLICASVYACAQPSLGWSRDSIAAWCHICTTCDSIQKMPESAGENFFELTYTDDSSGSFVHYYFDSLGGCNRYVIEWLMPEDVDDYLDMFSNTKIYTKIAYHQWRQVVYYDAGHKVPYRYIYWTLYLDQYDGATLEGELKSLTE